MTMRVPKGFNLQYCRGNDPEIQLLLDLDSTKIRCPGFKQQCQLLSYISNWDELKEEYHRQMGKQLQEVPSEPLPESKTILGEVRAQSRKVTKDKKKKKETSPTKEGGGGSAEKPTSKKRRTANEPTQNEEQHKE